jgi:formylglycine-generating enzyme required for sulfatase activity
MNKDSLLIHRGGAWNDLGKNCRSAYRLNDYPGARHYIAGLRLVIL